jgi:CHAD domain-containing protein
MSHSVSQFARHTAALRKAIEEILSRPKAEPVHVLRSTLRRIIAELRLLPESPEATKRIARFIRLTRPIIRAAGKVRDLDVHAGLLEGLPRRLQPEIDKLDREIDKKRRRRFSRLRRLVEDNHEKLLGALGELRAIAPGRAVAARVVRHEAVPGTFTSRELARETFARAAATLDLRQPDQLHELRKAARDARYLAESGLKGDDRRSGASRDAPRFRRIQQEVGLWHDYLTLAESAGRYLGESSPLVPEIERLRDRHYRSAMKSIQAAKS